jgi:hypothetical protein
MKQRPRIYYSENQKALMWERWRQGESLHRIAQLFDRGNSSIQGILSQTLASLRGEIILSYATNIHRQVCAAKTSTVGTLYGN